VGDLRPPTIEVESLGVAVTTSTGGCVGNNSTVDEKPITVGHDLRIDVRRTGTVARFTADTFFQPEAHVGQGIIILLCSDMAEQAAPVAHRILNVGVVRPKPGEIQRPVPGEPPVGVGVAAAQPGNPSAAVRSVAVALTADP